MIFALSPEPVLEPKPAGKPTLTAHCHCVLKPYLDKQANKQRQDEALAKRHIRDTLKATLPATSSQTLWDLEVGR